MSRISDEELERLAAASREFKYTSSDYGAEMVIVLLAELQRARAELRELRDVCEEQRIDTAWLLEEWEAKCAQRGHSDDPMVKAVRTILTTMASVAAPSRVRAVSTGETHKEK